MGSVPLRYHDATKHHFGRFARALGYLDWATQPDPFRRYDGTPLVELPRAALATDVPYAAVYGEGAVAPRPIDLHTIGEFLRCSMGLSAWKQYGASRWALRVNPSSGNLHPTETYLIWNGGVHHYAVKEHAIEERCALIAKGEEDSGKGEEAFLVALTSIHWRESWKYGERAFRYCQHDCGHAIAALRFAAALLGWRLRLLPHWSDAQIAAVLGLDREADFGAAEREEAECMMLVTTGDTTPWLDADPAPLVDAARLGTWQGRANPLSRDHIEWPVIDEIALATRFPGLGVRGSGLGIRGITGEPFESRVANPEPRIPNPEPRTPDARSIIVQRRSALAFNPKGVLTRATFLSMLGRLQPGAPPWDAVDWPPQVHLAMFVHRVQDVAPGLYAYLRDSEALARWKSAMRPEFLWERINDSHDPNGLFLLVPIDCTHAANRVSCDQEIAEDGFFSLGMIARLEASLGERGDAFYRRLFWECGIIGQILYLEAEAAGARATGIGCFYDDPVHDILGLDGHQWQSLYHFSMGLPIEDTRLTTAPGYDWEG